MSAAFDIAILCAVPVELDKVLHTGKNPWQLHHTAGDPGSYYETIYTTASGKPLRVIAASAPHMGMPASAMLAAKMILRFRPKLVGMVGIAAGVDRTKQGFGDILAPDTTFDHASGKITVDGTDLKFKPDSNPLRLNAQLVARLQDWKRQRLGLDAIRQAWQADKPRESLEMHVGPLGSGPWVVDARKPVSDVVEHWRKLVGIEMEAHGVHLACHNVATEQPLFLCMKAISDFPPEKIDTWQSYAAFSAAQLFHRFVTEEWDTLFPR